MTNVAAVETVGLGRRYGTKWGLRDCSLSVPEGSITGLVGPNGAGKSTLLRLAAGLSRPTTGTVSVFGERVRPNSTTHLEPDGLLRSAEAAVPRTPGRTKHFDLARSTTRFWDNDAALEWLNELDVPLNERVGRLSLGQQALVALALCLGKRPDLLVLDEPVASLDPVARRRLLEALLATVAEHGTTVFLSSHIISELEPVCDNLIILSSSNVRLSGSIESLLAEHRVLVGPRHEQRPSDVEIVSARHAELTIDAPGPRQPDGDRSGLADSRTRPRRDRPRLPRCAARRLLGPDQARRCLVIWLVFRRYRVLMAITVVALVGLAVWMILLGHVSDATESSFACTHGTFACSTRRGLFSLSDQATAINFLLLLVPCLLGRRFRGAPGRRRTRALHQPPGLDPGGLQDQVVDRQVGGRRVLSRRPSRCAGVRLPMVDRAGTRPSKPQSLAWRVRPRAPATSVLSDHRPRPQRLHALRVRAECRARRSGPEDLLGRLRNRRRFTQRFRCWRSSSYAPHWHHRSSSPLRPRALATSSYPPDRSTMKPGIWASAIRYVPGTPKAEMGSSADAVGQLCEDRPVLDGMLGQASSAAWGPSTNRQITTGSCSGASPLLLVIATGALFGTAILSVRRWRA